MRNFFVSDKQIVPAQGAPVLGMLVASWPWPCQKYDQTKNGHLEFFSFRKLKVRLGCPMREYCQFWGYKWSQIGGVVTGLGVY